MAPPSHVRLVGGVYKLIQPKGIHFVMAQFIFYNLMYDTFVNDIGIPGQTLSLKPHDLQLSSLPDQLKKQIDNDSLDTVKCLFTH